MGGSREVAAGLVRSLRDAGHQAYLVGGCVRDLELGLVPKDLDIATDATPERVIELFPRVVPTGIDHGTVTVIAGGDPYEVTTFRRDVDCDGRFAVVEHTASLEEDLERRDFTINAMALDPDSGEVIDLHGGRDDLRRRIVRCVGNPRLRFVEDRLRMMRAVRFAAQLDFQIEPDTWEALRLEAPALGRVSRERMADELWAILAAGAAPLGVTLLRHSGLLPVVLPEVAELEGVEQPARWHHLDVMDHTLLAFEHAARLTQDPLVRLGVLLHDIGKPRTATRDAAGEIHFYGHEDVGRRMAGPLLERTRLASSRRISMDTRQLRHALETLIGLHLRPLQLESAHAPALRRFVREAGPYLDAVMTVARCDRLAHRDPDVKPLDRLTQRLGELGSHHDIRALQPPLAGSEIMELLGIREGRAVGRAKQALLDAVVDGDLDPGDPARTRQWLRDWWEGQGSGGRG